MLQAVSYLAPNWFTFYQAVTDALARSLSINIQLQQATHDPLDDPLLLQDQLDLAFICGLPFIRHHQVNPHQLQVLAVPVLSPSRYQDRPIYFSDVIVNAASKITQIPDLVGQSFCYNDSGSNSGYNLVRGYLLSNGYTSNFFGACLQSGSHQRSLQWVAEGRADWAAIDSMVLEQALRDHPTWANQVQVIAAIGPSPMPPIVVANHLNERAIQTLRSALLHPDQILLSAMATAGVRRYDIQTWKDYEILAEIYNHHAPTFGADHY